MKDRKIIIKQIQLTCEVSTAFSQASLQFFFSLLIFFYLQNNQSDNTLNWTFLPLPAFCEQVSTLGFVTPFY